jgi:prevent-host-death family protein
MDVAVSTFRAHLGDWLDRAQRGEEVVVTERGVPIVRVVALTSTPAVERLVRDGVIAKPTGAGRPEARRHRRVASRGSVAELVGEQRR